MRYIIFFLIILVSCQSEKQKKIAEPIDEQKGTSQYQSLNEYPEDQNQNTSSVTFEDIDQSENEYSNGQAERWLVEGSVSFTSDKGYEYTVTIADFDPQDDSQSYNTDAKESSEE